MILKNKRYTGLLYRALNPKYAHEPLSGCGAEKLGGRFNRKGISALYMVLDPVTALLEASQASILQPTVLVCCNADVGPVFDACDMNTFIMPYCPQQNGKVERLVRTLTEQCLHR